MATEAAGLVEVRVPILEGLFSALDPSPFRERELDPRAQEHILQWAADVPAGVPVTLRVHVADGAVPPAGAEAAGDAVRRHFAYEAALLGRRHARNRSRALAWLGGGLLVMVGLLSLRELLVARFPDHRLVDVVAEALVVAGWVSLWIPIERLGFDGWLLRDQLKLVERLATMHVEFRHGA